eukprot:163206-Chlamydomonas_euryale.AAC.6
MAATCWIQSVPSPTAQPGRATRPLTQSLTAWRRECLTAVPAAVVAAAAMAIWGGPLAAAAAMLALAAAGNLVLVAVLAAPIPDSAKTLEPAAPATPPAAETLAAAAETLAPVAPAAAPAVETLAAAATAAHAR